MKYNIKLSPDVSPNQSGYILLMVMIFLLLLAMGSTHFLTRSTGNVQVSGSLRDSSGSLLLAEAAVEMLRGKFIADLNTVTEEPVDMSDKVATGALVENISFPDEYLLPYMFYVTKGAGIDMNKPSILQNIANGESISVIADPLLNRGISEGSILNMNMLFMETQNTTMSPFLYTVGSNGLLAPSIAESWNDEPAEKKVAVWIEVFASPFVAGNIELSVQAMAKIGNAKSYVQRHAGTYTSVLGELATLSEARNINPS